MSSAVFSVSIFSGNAVDMGGLTPHCLVEAAMLAEQARPLRDGRTAPQTPSGMAVDMDQADRSVTGTQAQANVLEL